ncbi:uncharacterized protein LOC131927553 [Physella acuta]|uniref:uncharacterized protein LOC131927553 n=1 Tax=Physella acuta TaxID=109671 RepID=UPI0027DE07B0|nr:uncharacterized protein LOC131927553 [Physella acuta]
MSISSIQTKKELIGHQIAILKEQDVEQNSVKGYITKVVTLAEEWVSNNDEENCEKSFLEMSQTMQNAIHIAAVTRGGYSLTQNWNEKDLLDPLHVCNQSETSEDVEETLSLSESRSYPLIEIKQYIDVQNKELKKEIANITKEVAGCKNYIETEQEAKIGLISEELKSCVEKVHTIQISTESSRKTSQSMSRKVEEMKSQQSQQRTELENLTSDVMAHYRELKAIETQTTSMDTKMLKMSNEMLTISKTLKVIEEQPGKHVIAFIASCIYNLKEPSVFSPFTNFTSISGNESGHFDPQKGVFTVPVDGMYLVCVSLALVSPRGSLRVIVVRNIGDEESLEICSVGLDESQKENSSTLLSKLKMGDNLHIILRESSGYTQFEAEVNFACAHLR